MTGGRASGPASAIERDGAITFVFPDGQCRQGAILEREPSRRFALVYFGGSTTTFSFNDDGDGGTDLTLTDMGVREVDRVEVTAGWVSVLLVLKAAVDFGVDLRNHDSQRSWEQGYAEN